MSKKSAGLNRMRESIARARRQLSEISVGGKVHGMALMGDMKTATYLAGGKRNLMALLGRYKKPAEPKHGTTKIRDGGTEPADKMIARTRHGVAESGGKPGKQTGGDDRKPGPAEMVRRRLKALDQRRYGKTASWNKTGKEAGKTDESNNGARTLGLQIAAMRPGAHPEQKRAADLIGRLHRVLPPGTKLHKSVTRVHESAEADDAPDEALHEATGMRLSRSELRRLDRVRRKRQRRGRGRATSRQRRAARKNAKKASKSLRKSSVRRKALRNRKRRARLRGRR